MKIAARVCNSYNLGTVKNMQFQSGGDICLNVTKRYERERGCLQHGYATPPKYVFCFTNSGFIGTDMA